MSDFRKLEIGEPAYVRNGNEAHEAEVIGSFLGIAVEMRTIDGDTRPFARERIYTLDELPRLVDDLYNEADRAGREGRRIQAVINGMEGGNGSA